MFHLDNIWPEFDVLGQIARQRAVDKQSADEPDREIVWSEPTGVDDSWLDKLWPDSDSQIGNTNSTSAFRTFPTSVPLAPL